MPYDGQWHAGPDHFQGPGMAQDVRMGQGLGKSALQGKLFKYSEKFERSTEKALPFISGYCAR